MDINRLKVLQLGKLYYPITGGIEKTMQQIAEGIQGHFDSHVLAAQPKGKKHSEIVNGVPVYYASSLGTVASLPISIDLVSYFCKHAAEYDIVHLHMPFPLGDMACLISGFKGKLIVYWHSDIVRQKKFMVLYKPIMNALLRRADIIVIATQGNIDGSEYVKPYAHKCVIIPFGLSKSIEIKSDSYWTADRRINVKDEHETKLKLLFIGRLVYYKGCDVLIEALTLLKDTEIELTIVGSGKLKDELKKKVELEKLERHVHFRGSISDKELNKEIESNDVFVLPSTANSEAFGLVQLEAMVYGKPVINTSLPTGVPFVSLDGETGVTIEPNNAAELANAIRWMKEHPKERIEMGEKARKRVKEEFSEERLINRMIHLYQESS